MTELEKMQRAKMYVDKLAEGVNPLDDSRIPDGDVINNVRLSRCLFYVSDILRQVIENGGRVGTVRNKDKEFFSLSDNEKAKLIPCERGVTVKDITDFINSLIDPGTMKKLKATSIAGWLVSVDILEILQDSTGKNIKRPTDDGKMLGIFTEQRYGQNGAYTIVCYSPEAQQFIYDNIEAIIQFNNSGYNTKENQGEPWTALQEELVRDLHSNGASVREIALALKRSNGAVRARMAMMGLIEKA